MPEDPEDNSVMEKHGAETLYSTEKSVMHAIHTADKDAEHVVAHWMIHPPKARMLKRQLQSKPANAKPLIPIPKGNVHFIDPM